jgi:hypothetical protein
MALILDGERLLEAALNQQITTTNNDKEAIQLNAA